MKNHPLSNKDEWKLVGHFGVDAGLCWIGDPCYILHREEPGLPETLGKNWGEFCDLLDRGESGPTQKSFAYGMGHEGLGVCLSTGMGDGFYPVYALIKKEGQWGERIQAVFIDFFDLMAEDEEGEKDDDD